jgi:hypothetical protein
MQAQHNPFVICKPQKSHIHMSTIEPMQVPSPTTPFP